jgi:mannosyl-glycoprotein endo-beta-N-acetylglucosaminidase
LTPTIFTGAIPTQSSGAKEVPASPAAGFAGALASREALGSAPTVTPMRGSAAAAALSSAYQSVLGEPPSKATLAVLVSQWSLETGGGRAMMDYNFGGIKGRSPSGQSVSYMTSEGSGDTARSLVDAFRAYGSPQEGAADYVRLLRDHFPNALAQARAGNPAGFVHALKSSGYFTGSEKSYTDAVSSTARRVMSSGFDAAGSASGDPANLLEAVSGAAPDLSGAGVDIAAFSYQLDLAALRIGIDPTDR